MPRLINDVSYKMNIPLALSCLLDTSECAFIRGSCANAIRIEISCMYQDFHVALPNVVFPSKTVTSPRSTNNAFLFMLINTFSLQNIATTFSWSLFIFMLV